MLRLLNLDERIRERMLDEVEHDLRNGTLYVSPRLSNTGQQNYVTLLKEAIRSHDDAWLGEQLGRLGRLRPTEQRRKPKGGYTVARVPVTAPASIAESEFNRFYMRGLCRVAIEDGVPEVIVYRAKRVARPRPTSQERIGTHVGVRALLDDLRAHPGVETALGIPPGHNSGLSVRLPEAEAHVDTTEA